MEQAYNERIATKQRTLLAHATSQGHAALPTCFGENSVGSGVEKPASDHRLSLASCLACSASASSSMSRRSCSGDGAVVAGPIVACSMSHDIAGVGERGACRRWSISGVGDDDITIVPCQHLGHHTLMLAGMRSHVDTNTFACMQHTSKSPADCGVASRGSVVGKVVSVAGTYPLLCDEAEQGTVQLPLCRGLPTRHAHAHILTKGQ